MSAKTVPLYSCNNTFIEMISPEDALALRLDGDVYLSTTGRGRKWVCHSAKLIRPRPSEILRLPPAGISFREMEANAGLLGSPHGANYAQRCQDKVDAWRSTKDTNAVLV